MPSWSMAKTVPGLGAGRPINPPVEQFASLRRKKRGYRLFRHPRSRPLHDWLVGHAGRRDHPRDIVSPKVSTKEGKLCYPLRVGWLASRAQPFLNMPVILSLDFFGNVGERSVTFLPEMLGL